jgi:DNA-binding NtrC family response regulator
MTSDRQTRVLVFHEDARLSAEAQSHLERAGFDVTCARSFLAAAPNLARGKSNLLLLYPPETARLRSVLLAEVRRVAPSLPIVVMATMVTDDLRHLLHCFGVAAILPAKTSWDDVVRAIRHELAGSPAQERKGKSMSSHAHASELATTVAAALAEDLPEARRRSLSIEPTKPRPLARVILYQRSSPEHRLLADELVRAGFEVLPANQFQDAAAWLALYPESVLLVQPPVIDVFRRSVLEAVRRAARGHPIIAIVHALTPDVEDDLSHAAVFQTLAADVRPAEIVAAVLAAATADVSVLARDDGSPSPDGT